MRKAAFRGRGKSWQTATSQNKSKYYKVPKEAKNPLNQYFHEKFKLLKRDCDQKNLQNQSFCYKRVLNALAKYPMPILCQDQIQFLEGVGDTVAQKFQQMLTDRQKEYEDQVFQMIMLKEQNQQKPQTKKAEKARMFNVAGIQIPEDQQDLDISNMSLKECIVYLDRQNLALNQGIQFNEPKNVANESMSQGNKKKKFSDLLQDGFLDVGSLSWTTLIASYVLFLHSDQENYCFSIQSIKEMIEVLDVQFNDMIPLEADPIILTKNQDGVLLMFKEQDFIKINEPFSKTDTSSWLFNLTKKGIKRAQALCKSAGLHFKLDVNQENKNLNNITIEVYDKNQIELLDDLNQLDCTHLKAVKNQNLEEQLALFDPYFSDIEIECQKFIRPLSKQHQKEMQIIKLQDEKEEEKENIPLQEYNTCENNKPHKQRKKSLRRGKIKSDEDFEIVLVVDNREKRNQSNTTYFIDRLVESGINTEQKSLPIGDFLWILRVDRNKVAVKKLEEEVIESDKEVQEVQEIQGNKRKSSRKKLSPTNEPQNYILDYIVERKTADDLAASIMDGRYQEQKYRLKNSGINSIIYLIEGEQSGHNKIPRENLQKAQLNTQIINNFSIVKQTSTQDTLNWLIQMTNKIIERIYELKDQLGNDQFYQVVQSFQDMKEFNKSNTKNTNLTIQELFARQLRTIKGLGIENCSTIARVFKTPNTLNLCYSLSKDGEAQCLNLLNIAKLELMKQKYKHKQKVNEDDIEMEDGNPDLPRSISSNDKTMLTNILSQSNQRVYHRFVKDFQHEFGVPLRKISKNQCELLYKLFCSQTYEHKGKGKSKTMEDIDEKEFESIL